MPDKRTRITETIEEKGEGFVFERIVANQLRLKMEIIARRTAKKNGEPLPENAEIGTMRMARVVATVYPSRNEGAVADHLNQILNRNKSIPIWEIYNLCTIIGYPLSQLISDAQAELKVQKYISQPSDK